MHSFFEEGARSDVCVMSRNWSEGDLGTYEKAATAFIFVNFFLSFVSTVVSVKVLQEIRLKTREEYNLLSVIPDYLQFEADSAKS